MSITWELPEARDKLKRKDIAALFLRQNGLCPLCGQKLQTKGHTPVHFIDEHMKPLWKLGSNNLSNRALVCKPCAAAKTSEESSERSKCLSVRDKHIGAKKSRTPMKFGRDSRLKRCMDGTVRDRETGEIVGRKGNANA